MDYRRPGEMWEEHAVGGQRGSTGVNGGQRGSTGVNGAACWEVAWRLAGSGCLVVWVRVVGCGLALGLLQAEERGAARPNVVVWVVEVAAGLDLPEVSNGRENA